MDDNGRFPPITRLATGAPFFSGEKVKSVNSLFKKKPPATNWLPNGPSIVDVILAILPLRSTAVKCVVPATSLEMAAVRGIAPGGFPAG